VAIQIDPPECNEPDNLLAERTGPETASLSWSTVSGITGYDMEYRLKNSLTWEYQPVNVNNHPLSNLICDTSYEWRVRANCGNGVYSEWKHGDDFKTAACGNTTVQDLTIYDLIVYPNPTSDHLYIKSRSHVYNNCMLSVTDITGKVVYLKYIDALEPNDIHEINVTKFANGIYILRIYNKNITAIERIIIDH
jgi:hypothetical protein